MGGSPSLGSRDGRGQPSQRLQSSHNETTVARLMQSPPQLVRGRESVGAGAGAGVAFGSGAAVPWPPPTGLVSPFAEPSPVQCLNSGSARRDDVRGERRVESASVSSAGSRAARWRQR